MKPIPTFAEIAKLVIADAQARSINAKVRYQVARHLGPVYCGPLLNRPVNEITTTDIADVLRPIWRSKPEVARKTYPKIRKVFERARRILRDEHSLVMPENPALWDDLEALGFEPAAQLSRGHHPALPYGQMAAFVSELRSREGTAARALEFLILTNVRTDAVLKASRDQFDLEGTVDDGGEPTGPVWTVPLTSLKDRKHRTVPFRVPLSARAVEIVKQMQEVQTGRFVFPGQSGNGPLSNMAMLLLLKRMNDGAEDPWVETDSGRPITAHGFRASFKTWAEESSVFPNALIETSMGHKVGGKVEAAYMRGALLKKRRQLMDAWATYCEPRAAGPAVVQFDRRRKALAP